MKIANVEVDITPERLLEIATMAIGNMFEYDRHNAIEVCRTEFTDVEWDLFDIDSYNQELIDEEYYENPYTGEQYNPRTMETEDDKDMDELEREIIEGKHPYLEPLDI